MPPDPEDVSKIRKEQALDLAQLIYDIFTESELNDNDKGQNHADQTQDE